MFLQILQYIAAGATVATGLVSLFWPRAVRGFTGLNPDGGRGVTEIRAVLGGVFIALGALPLVLGESLAYQILGITYLVIGAIRLVSMFLDKSVVQSNIISLLVELVFGVVLVL
ncbi:MAG: DUF4345 domain-containing protein [Chloroflexia bacterium]|nr:DUF4345 domain-containing protein [Chloroflexia bacterium]